MLGIDAGGTKTVCLLADERGQIVAEARAGGANLQSAGELEVEKVLHGIMDQALGDRDVRPDAMHDAADRRRVGRSINTGEAEAKRIGFKSRVLGVNDALIELLAGAGDDPGVVI